jgi:ribosomal protein L3 glutamine methyltransferase
MTVDYPAAAAELHTLADYIRWGASRFREAGLAFGHGTDNPVDEATALVLHALHLDPQPPAELFAARLTRDEREAVLALFRRRIQERVPVPYLTGEAWFAGLPFQVDRRVLVPRSPMAELVQDGFEPWLGGRYPERILDLCTGSGCIAVAAALAFPEARVDASDVSPEALEVAAANVARYGLGDRLALYRSDLFADLPRVRYDLILSNPPYVDAAELAAMPPEFHHEPRLGLAAGEDGLEAVRRILADAPAFLAPGGVLVVEVGASRPALEAAYPLLPFHWPELEGGGEGVFVLEAEALGGGAR